MKKVIQLIRVSTDRQAASDRASIPAQRTVNQRTCAQHGLEIVRSIEMADVSGACVLLAPETQELTQLMRSPEIHGVVAREFSRLMRPENFEDFALLQVFVDTKTVLYLPEGPLDFSSKTGRLLGTIRAAIAGMERTEMLERVWSAKEEKRRRGELAQSKIVLPWGVDYENGRFFYKPEAEKVREAFRQFLGGKQNYLQLSKMLGVTPRGMHLIMRNPIWTGLRVIDKKRDASSGGRYATIDGRQADRRKVFRSPEDVIRVRVITEPLISEEDFQAVQRIMDRKQSKHWRSRTDLQHRFTYNGFLTCSDCGDQIHTAFARRDYYACKGRRISHSCTTKYMARERLEEALDGLFADYLTKASFLHACIAETENRLADDEVLLRNQRLGVCLSSMREKRARAIDAFLEGVISKEDRDQRLFGIDREIGETENLLMQEIQPAMTAETMVRAFAPLVEWRSWTRDEKRLVLAALIPDIRVANYRVSAIGTDFSNESIPAPADSTTTVPATANAPRP